MKYAFCHNTRRWMVLQDLKVVEMPSCPHEGRCDECDYHEEREPTRYLKARMAEWREAAKLMERVG